MNTYGEMNTPWNQAGSGAFINFHSGLDISYEDIGNQNIWSIEDGVYTYCEKFLDPQQGIIEYIAVVSQNSSSNEGWCYCHADGSSGSPYSLSYVWGEPPGTVSSSLGDLIGVMSARTDKHLHFARSEAIAPEGYHGIDNPLDYLIPEASSVENFTWTLSSPNKRTFFLQNYLAFNDPSNQDWEHKWLTPSTYLHKSA